MRRQFLIKFYVPEKGDPFGMGDAKGHITTYCNSLVDLTKTLRCLMAKGYRVKKPATWGRKFKQSNQWGSLNLFGNKTFDAKEIHNTPPISKTVDYTNGWGYAHRIKITDVDFEKS